MSREYSQILSEVAVETLEQLAFIFSFADEPDENAIWETDAIGCHVRFSGSQQGELLMTINRTVLPEMAANMLGLDDDEEALPQQQHDALKEALNIICGNLLPTIGGVEAVYDISAPTIHSMREMRCKVAALKADKGDYGAAFLSLDDGECHIYLRYGKN